ncbi:hypothetical protein MTR67_004108, partial [Solanum verrucosum]
IIQIPPQQHCLLTFIYTTFRSLTPSPPIAASAVESLLRFPRRSAAAAIAQTVADFSSTNDRASSTKQRKKKRRAEKETEVAPEAATI